MKKLSTNALIETFLLSEELGLAKVFMELITDEMNQRGITEIEIDQFREVNQNKHD